MVALAGEVLLLMSEVPLYIQRAARRSQTFAMRRFLLFFFITLKPSVE